MKYAFVGNAAQKIARASVIDVPALVDNSLFPPIH
jgi:hypothetical protein